MEGEGGGERKVGKGKERERARERREGGREGRREAEGRILTVYMSKSL